MSGDENVVSHQGENSPPAETTRLRTFRNLNAWHRALSAKQADGLACIECGSIHADIPVGLIHESQVFACEGDCVAAVDVWIDRALANSPESKPPPITAEVAAIWLRLLQLCAKEVVLERLDGRCPWCRCRIAGAYHEPDCLVRTVETFCRALTLESQQKTAPPAASDSGDVPPIEDGIRSRCEDGKRHTPEQLITWLRFWGDPADAPGSNATPQSTRVLYREIADVLEQLRGEVQRLTDALRFATRCLECGGRGVDGDESGQYECDACGGQGVEQDRVHPMGEGSES